MTPDYVIYGTARWDDAWLTEQNLAHSLARDHRVLYVEPAVSPLSPIRYGVSLDSIRTLDQLRKRRLQSVGALHVLSPITLPPAEHPQARRASRPILRAQVRRAVRKLGLERPAVVAARSALDLLGAADERASVYLVKDLNEAGGSILGKDPDLMARQMAAMCKAADVVVAVTSSLQETLAGRGVDAHVIRHGFHADLAFLYDEASPPPEYARMPPPRVGYAGRIDARLDFGAIAEVADRVPRGSLILVGPVSPRLAPEALGPLKRRPNVHFLGARERLALPAYLRHLDCGLLPYEAGEWTSHGSPLKLWDYLYAGPPIAGCGVTALHEFPQVGYAESGPDLPGLVDELLQSPNSSHKERRALALANTWDHRAAELDALVGRALRG